MTRMFSILSLLAILAVSCIEKDFDEPPVVDETVTVETNATISDIKDFFVPSEFVEITDDLTFDAIVVADDEGGNFYKKLVLSDETGGIEIQLNRTDLYTEYELGRKVFVKAQGLYVSDFNGLIQLGSAPIAGGNGQLQLGRIDNALVSEYVLRGAFEGVPMARNVTIGELAPDDISTLVTLCDVQFITNDTSSTFADVPGQRSLNLQLEDCDFNTLIMRSSNFASFAADNVPNGSGCITGVYGVFGQDKQLLIRTIDDVSFTDTRCGGGGSSGGGEPGEVTLTVQQVRALFTGGSSNLPTENGIQGVVISDQQAGSTTGRNMVIQQDGYGIVVRFEAGDFHSFNPGDEVFVDVSGIELSEFNGLLQLNEVPLNNAIFISGNNTVTPVTLTVGDLLADSERYESTLIEIKAATLSPDNGDWERTTVVNDGTGVVDLYTQPFANFAAEAPPTDTVDVVAIVGEFNNVQLSIRNTNDVTVSGGSSGGGGTGGNGTAVSSVSEDFQSLSDRDEVSLADWTNYTAVAGGRTWQARDFQGNLYAQATAFNDMASEMNTWLITPLLDLDAQLELSFETATAFNVHQGLEVVISTDWDGTSDPASANWTTLNLPLADGSSGDNNWVEANNVDLSSYSGTGYVAFHYTGSGAQNTSTFRVDNVLISPQ